MVNTDARFTVSTPDLPVLKRTVLLFAMLLALSGLRAGNPVATAIPVFTTAVNVATEFVVNGAFEGDNLSYTATLINGRSLPSWISLDRSSGTFTFRAPASAIGDRTEIRITATDSKGNKVSENFFVNIDDPTAECDLNANTDDLEKILDCNTKKVILRGFTSSGQFRWTGPDGYTSDEEEPTVSTPGVYQLVDPGMVCERSSAVEVFAKAADCKKQSSYNVLPTVRLSADRSRGSGPLTVRFDASGSTDSDGSVLHYRIAWDGGEATGPRPEVIFQAGTYEVTLTVSDNTGAKSTDRLTVAVSDEQQVTAEYWLEAECAEIGKNWSINKGKKASEGAYVYSSSNSIQKPPADNGDNRIRFTFDAVAGDYSLFALIDAYDNTSDSYWVRVNGGGWLSWSSGLVQKEGFTWNSYPQEVKLKNGRNDIDFAFREADTNLDKIMLSASGEAPKGTGLAASNCNTNMPPRAVATADAYSGPAPLTVKLDGSKSSDPDNKIVRYDWKWQNGGGGSGDKNTVTFPTGNYTVSLTVTDESGASDTDVIAIQSIAGSVDIPKVPTDGGTEIWLEAECAEVGDRWTRQTTSSASAGTYVVVNGLNSTKAAPADKAENRVRFSFDATAGTYALFARAEAKSNLDDSFWVRVNGGQWYAWKDGMSQGKGFHWNQLPGDGVTLRGGNNVIDVAYREDGTRLDKLMLTSSMNIQPSGTGPTATNCAEENTAAGSDVWLEAECAELGRGWQTEASSSASRGLYTVHIGKDEMEQPTKDKSKEQLTFRFNVVSTATYRLFLRMQTFDAGTNSFWVRVDNGDWIQFWTEANGDELSARKMEWKEVNNDGKLVSLLLSAGQHTITINNRESGTLLDKLHLTASGRQPSGEGSSANNCTSSTTMGSLATIATQTTTIEADVEVVAEDFSELIVYPNPVSDWLTLELTSDFSGTAEVTVTDLAGRRVIRQVLNKSAGFSTTRVEVRDLPAGMYHVRVIEGDRQSVKPFVKR